MDKFYRNYYFKKLCAVFKFNNDLNCLGSGTNIDSVSKHIFAKTPMKVAAVKSILSNSSTGT